MSILQLMDGYPSPQLITMGISGTFAGYSRDPGVGIFGNIAPSGIAKGWQIRALYSDTSTSSLVLMVNSILVSQFFFTSIALQDTSSIWRTYKSVDASFLNPSVSVWTWASGAPWVSIGAGAVRQAVFF